MTEAKDSKPIHDDVDLSRAWQIGRRIYVRCGYASQLNTQLREIGATWDPEVGALWVGTGKRDRVIPLILAADKRGRAIDDVKAQGRWIAIPYYAADIRDRAKELGAVWDGERKQWAMPTDETLAEVEGLMAERRRREDEAKREADRQHAEEVRRGREQAKVDARHAEVSARDRLIAESGRTATGETAELRIVSTRRMNKATARTIAYRMGAVVRLDDGRYGIVIDVKVWFTGEEMASSVCWHPETHDDAHWDLLHTVAIVEATAEEQTADDAQRAELADAAEIHQTVEASLRAGDVTEEWSAIEQSQVVGVIRCWYGTVQKHSAGTLTLTADGRVIRQHPGYYDDYRRTERVGSDPALVARVRAILDGGARTRHYTDQMTYDYEVEATRFDPDRPL